MIILPAVMQFFSISIIGNLLRFRTKSYKATRKSEKNENLLDYSDCRKLVDNGERILV